MADKKKDTGKKTGGKTYKKTPVKQSDKKDDVKKKPEKQQAREEKTPKSGEKKKRMNAPAGLLSQLLPFVLGVIAVFFAICLLANGVGVVGAAIKNVLFGLFAGASYTLPLYLILIAVMWRADSENGVLSWKICCCGVTYLLTAVILHFLAGGADTFNVVELYRSGCDRIGGGAIGGLIGAALMFAFDRILSLVLLFALLFVFVLLIFGITPRGLWILISYKHKMRKERLALERAEAEVAAAEKERASRPKPRIAETTGVQQKLEPIDEEDEFPLPTEKPKQFYDAAEEEDSVPAAADTASDSEGVIDEKIFDEVMRRTRARLEQSGAAAPAADEDDLPWDENLPAERGPADVMDEDDLDRMAEDELDLAAIFSDKKGADLSDRVAGEDASADAASADMDIELTVERRTLTETLTQTVGAADPIAEPPVPEYKFPPIDLLSADESLKDENVAEELRENAARLVETLKNFNVRTKIVDVCRGPTITRYELAPEPGTKVRSIANLVDDIALNLATSGVRFEPSIPGKSAVGIEVPNKNPATVHLRTLLENPRFGAAKSRLSAALGQDVAGADVFLDVAKMPHLLIAGATGQGKSVCINSLIVSLLYKAKPDELKFIMVDPKKVELNVYNGIPHLYMPVISDPKKAAGALSWAVSEMERRYSLIEEVGVRDLKSYNEITKDDPQYEFLPQFVIIIDELADLMMVAKNDVEAPICRIAQKARAAGMHLIIGTQRPSVDVITGLIKANFPSRISFRVSQLVDSRTIIDRAGAESLVGRGDMLYSPVGSHEPMRVQGAFVSDTEVESVVEFIKHNNGDAEYNSTAIAEVERNAASIAVGKKGTPSADGEDDGEDTDPMLRPAIELAVESGKISTSLIQRRLSLGYGRAAKLIDKMEQLGYVSAPDGQKPREVLITKEQFMEMVLRDTDS